MLTNFPSKSEPLSAFSLEKLNRKHREIWERKCGLVADLEKWKRGQERMARLESQGGALAERMRRLKNRTGGAMGADYFVSADRQLWLIDPFEAIARPLSPFRNTIIMPSVQARRRADTIRLVEYWAGTRHLRYEVVTGGQLATAAQRQPVRKHLRSQLSEFWRRPEFKKGGEWEHIEAVLVADEQVNKRDPKTGELLFHVHCNVILHTPRYLGSEFVKFKAAFDGAFTTTRFRWTLTKKGLLRVKLRERKFTRCTDALRFYSARVNRFMASENLREGGCFEGVDIVGYKANEEEQSAVCEFVLPQSFEGEEIAKFKLLFQSTFGNMTKDNKQIRNVREVVKYFTKYESKAAHYDDLGLSDLHDEEVWEILSNAFGKKQVQLLGSLAKLARDLRDRGERIASVPNASGDGFHDEIIPKSSRRKRLNEDGEEETRRDNWRSNPDMIPEANRLVGVRAPAPRFTVVHRFAVVAANLTSVDEFLAKHDFSEMLDWQMRREMEQSDRMARETLLASSWVHNITETPGNVSDDEELCFCGGAPPG